MGWAVGRDSSRRRHIGYGVPSECDHPDCSEMIDRGLAYACGGGVTEEAPNCGLFFCGRHMSISYVRDGEIISAAEAYGEVGPDQDCDDFEERDDFTSSESCERCIAGLPPFDPKPDSLEWVNHVLTDETWAEWREEEPAWRADMEERLAEIA